MVWWADMHIWMRKVTAALQARLPYAPALFHLCHYDTQENWGNCAKSYLVYKLMHKVGTGNSGHFSLISFAH